MPDHRAVTQAPDLESIVQDEIGFEHPAMQFISQLSRQELSSHLTGDKWRDNLILNAYERIKGIARLESYPWRFSVPFVLCDAKCEFCSAWLVKGEFMDPKLMDYLDVVLPYLKEVSLVGWGEPLIHPQFGRILEQLRENADPRAGIELTTNGVHLDQWIDRLLAARVFKVAVSIHAASPATHEDLMGLKPGDFERVIAAIGRLTSLRQEHPLLNVRMVFIVTRQNLGELPRFIRLTEDLGVDGIFFRTLQPRTVEEVATVQLDYHRLPPYLHPDFEALRAAAIEAIAESDLVIEAAPATWSTSVFPVDAQAEILARPLTPRDQRKKVKVEDSFPAYAKVKPVGEPVCDSECAGPIGELENPYGREPPIPCRAPYTTLYVNGFHNMMTPCCYMMNVPGHSHIFLQPSRRFEEAWNSPAMVALRETLHRGPLMQPCLKCPAFF